MKKLGIILLRFATMFTTLFLNSNSNELGAIKIPQGSQGLKYRTHLANTGWTGYTYDGLGFSGTTGQSRRMEAIDLNGSDCDGFTVVAKAHIQGIGWRKSFTTGVSGTIGFGKRLEAIQIKLSRKKADRHSIMYRVHVSGKGWMPWAYNGETAGTTGESRAIEAIQIIIKKIW